MSSYICVYHHLNYQLQSMSDREIHALIVKSPSKTDCLDSIPTSLTKQGLVNLLSVIVRIVNHSLPNPEFFMLSIRLFLHHS